MPRFYAHLIKLMSSWWVVQNIFLLALHSGSWKKVANITMRPPLSYNAELTPSKIFIFNDPILAAAQRFLVAKLKGALRLEYKKPSSPGLEFFPLCGYYTWSVRPHLFSLFIVLYQMPNFVRKNKQSSTRTPSSRFSIALDLLWLLNARATFKANSRYTGAESADKKLILIARDYRQPPHLQQIAPA